jgi:chaperone LolA
MIIFLKTSIFIVLFFQATSLWAKGFVPNSFQSDFTQSIESSLTNRIQQSFGKIYFSKPKNLRIEITKPDITTYVSNQQTSWYYQAPAFEGVKGEVLIDEQSKGNNLLVDFLNLIDQGLNSNKDYRIKSNGRTFELIMLPHVVTKLGIIKARLVFQTVDQINLKHLTRILLDNKDNKKLSFDFQNPTIDAALSSELFTFIIPPNTNTRKN